jgi:uncharacterized zinc-type alcohol dehydrogenase-like protein
MSIQAYAALEARAELQPYTYEPAALGPHDVEIAISHCGLCHSDIHVIDNDWGVSQYPLVPGHEIVGTVRLRGVAVQHLQLGQRVGVGWQSGSCLVCDWCLVGDEHSCAQQQATCVGRPGGFATAIRLDGRFAHPIPEGLASADAAPLLCAGVTVYSPLKGVRPAQRIGIIGVGGLGHLALQFARITGAEVTAFSTTPDKEAEARRFGAQHFVASKDVGQMQRAVGSLDLLLSTVTAPLDWAQWLNLLRPHGTLCFVGASPGTINIAPLALITKERTVRGSAIGSRATMREMLAVAARHGIRAQAEVLPMREVNAAIKKVRANQARYRVVLEN